MINVCLFIMDFRQLGVKNVVVIQQDLSMNNVIHIVETVDVCKKFKDGSVIPASMVIGVL